VPFCRVVRPDDPECFIHLVPNEEGHALELAMEKLPCTLERLGLTVSTGRVVDFRAREWLRPDPGPRTVPLIYPTHFERGFVTWPKTGSRKPNAIVLDAASADLMVPSGVYVLVKRFSSKEEPRRVVAALFDPDRAPCKVVGFENHLNYFHERGEPLDRTLALGLAGFLNSSPLDTYFRQFNGHTQVNATDLRTLRYPSRSALIGLGKRLADSMPEQAVLDRIVEEVLGAPVGNVNAESA
jgi:adenine-specific DNA-methyltransferase